MYVVAVEGPDGVGKSTQVEILKNRLESEGNKVYTTHFPRYETPIGGLIGDILNGKKEMPSFDAMQMLYAADQTDFAKELKRLKEEGYDYVLLDRYDLSTITYLCTKLDNFSLISQVLGWQNGITKPDLTIVLTSNKSINDKGEYKELDEFEKDKAFMLRLNHGYNMIYRKLRGSRLMHIVDCDKTIEEVGTEIYDSLIEAKQYGYVR